MKKFKLELDALEVDTFATLAEATPKVGTVHGYRPTIDEGTCNEPSCNGGPICGQETWDQTCPASCAYTCANTCDDPTCAQTCAYTCDDLTCQTCEATCNNSCGVSCANSCWWWCNTRPV